MLKPSIRALNPNSEEEINLVASRMRLTLIDVLGEDRGGAMYSIDWLVDRVREHISMGDRGRVLLVEHNGEVVGQAMARLEGDCVLFSTVYVQPEHRRKGIAGGLIKAISEWSKEIGVSKIEYNTAKNHINLIKLFQKFNFVKAYDSGEMTKLIKKI